MENKIQLTKEIILNHQFTPNVKGYDPSEVDDFLDRIIEDYKTFEKFEKESKEYIQSLETENRRIKEAYKAVGRPCHEREHGAPPEDQQV